jgi:hypothetical protein
MKIKEKHIFSTVQEMPQSSQRKKKRGMRERKKFLKLRIVCL